LSFGLQSANNETLKKIGRLHNYEEFLRALNLAKEAGFENINADLILGLPERVEEFENTIKKVVNLPLQHISLYALETHGGAFEQLCSSYGYTEDNLADMYDFARSQFADAGFLRYEVSNFAKVGYECKHNCVYWKENRYFGFGAAASGFVADVRYGNVYDIKKYIQGNGQAKEYCDTISANEEAYEYVMLGLRLQNGIDLSDFEQRFNVKFADKFPNVSKLIDGGFLKTVDNRLFVADNEFYVLNSILVELLPD
jgi:oxygen-independent coproporphyrinogen-3 oxidase